MAIQQYDHHPTTARGFTETVNGNLKRAEEIQQSHEQTSQDFPQEALLGVVNTVIPETGAPRVYQDVTDEIVSLSSPSHVEGGVANVDIDGNNALQIKAIGVVISTFETLPMRCQRARSPSGSISKRGV